MEHQEKKMQGNRSFGLVTMKSLSLSLRRMIYKKAMALYKQVLIKTNASTFMNIVILVAAFQKKEKFLKKMGLISHTRKVGLFIRVASWIYTSTCKIVKFYRYHRRGQGGLVRKFELLSMRSAGGLNFCWDGYSS